MHVWRASLISLSCSFLILPTLLFGEEPATKDAKEKIRELLPAAAGVSWTAWKATGIPDKAPKAEQFKNQPLTVLLMSLRFTRESLADANQQREFRFFSGLPRVDSYFDAVSKSEQDGYASVIQSEYITDFACNSTEDTALGFVTFQAKKIYAGRVAYQARKLKGQWMITEFSLPAWGKKTSLGADGNWKISEVDSKSR